MNCETCLEKVEAFYKSEDPNLKGILVITDFRIAFKFYFDNMIDRLGYSQDYFNLPLFTINKTEKAHEKKNFKRYTLELYLKDSRQIKLIIVSDHIKFYHRINELIISNSPSTFYQ